MFTGRLSDKVKYKTIVKHKEKNHEQIIVDGEVYIEHRFLKKTIKIEDSKLTILPPDAPIEAGAEVYNATGRRVWNMLTNNLEMLKKAAKEGFAIPAINTQGGQYDIIRACTKAAQEMRSPIILAHYVSTGSLFPLFPDPLQKLRRSPGNHFHPDSGPLLKLLYDRRIDLLLVGSIHRKPLLLTHLLRSLSAT